MLETLQSYLVDLGFDVKSDEFNQMRGALTDMQKSVQGATAGASKSMKELDAVIKDASKAMSVSLVVAASSVIGALASINGAIGALIENTAKADMEYQKFALRLWTTKDTAKDLKTVMDAMGEKSMEDIAFIPELRNQFMQLSQMGNQMKTPGDASGQLKFIRSIGFEFTRMKLEASYAMEWISYYLIKYLAGPLGTIKKSLGDFNDKISATMPEWTAKIAKGLMNFVNLGMGLARIIYDLYRGVTGFFEMIPAGAKKAMLGLMALWGIMLLNPVGQLMAAFAAVVILIEDFYGYIDGRKSSKKLAPIWQQLIDWFETIKNYTQEFMGFVGELWDDLVGGATRAERALQGYWDTFKQSEAAQKALSVLSDLWNDVTNAISIDKLQSYWDTFKQSRIAKAALEVLDALFQLLETIAEECVDVLADLFDAFKDLFGETLDKGTTELLVELFVEFLTAVKEIILGVVHLNRELGKMFKTAAGTAAAKAMWSWFKGTIQFCVKLVAMLTRSFFGLFSIIGLAMQGKFKEAAEKGKQIFSIFKRDMDNLFSSKASAAGKLGGGGLGGGGKSPQNIQEFMEAIGQQESGGNYESPQHMDNGLWNMGGKYQILASNWPSWAADAGLGSDAPYTKENQDIVARYKMNELYAQYGDWRLVAAAWNGGAGGAESYRKYGNESYEAGYVNSVMGNLPSTSQQQDDYSFNPPDIAESATRPSDDEATQPSENSTLGGAWEKVKNEAGRIADGGNLIFNTSYADATNSAIASNIPNYSSGGGQQIVVGDIYVNDTNATPQDIQTAVLTAIQKATGSNTARQVRDLGGVIV